MGLYVLALLIVAGLLAVVWQLDKLNAQLQAIAQVGNREVDAVHDVTHPVFSVQQLVRIRQQFERDYKRQLQRETELFTSSDWCSPRERRRVCVATRAFAGELRGVGAI